MAPFAPSPDAAARVKGRVVVMTGGSNGIGAATLRALHAAGALVVFGDLDEAAAASLLQSLPQTESQPTFVPTDAAAYRSVLHLFQTAWDRHGRVDHAIPIAGVGEPFAAPWFPPQLGVATVQEPPPPTGTLDVNLTGVCFFARIAVAYMRDSPPVGDLAPGERSLTLLSSTTGFKEAPGVPMYQVSKHGVLGLMRSLRSTLPVDYGVRVNALCPWMTDTALIQDWTKEWRAANLPLNEVEDVAAAMLGVIGGGPDLNGVAVVVEGGRMFEMEAEIARYEGAIWGEHFATETVRAQKLLNTLMAAAAQQSN